METINYGLILKKPKKHHWVMGSGKATQKLGADAEVINQKGDWRPYDSTKELQRRNGLETQNCTNFGTYLALIALAKLKKLPLPDNCSERYSGIGTGTTKQGNDPWKVIETIATKIGALPETQLPFSDDINTWEEYYSPAKDTKEYRELLAQGEQVLRRLEIEPEWVIPPFATYDNKHDRLKRALTRGPVCVSVHAWEESEGFYVKSGPDNHWVWLTHFEGNNPVIRDQYQPFRKVLSNDYDFGSAILYFMRPNTTGFLPKDKPLAIRIIQEIIRLYRQLLP